MSKYFGFKKNNRLFKRTLKYLINIFKFLKLLNVKWQSLQDRNVDTWESNNLSVKVKVVVGNHCRKEVKLPGVINQVIKRNIKIYSCCINKLVNTVNDL